MESEIESASFDKKGWIGKIKEWSQENWQTILVVLIVLIVGISAYNYNQQKNSLENKGSLITNTENNEANDDSQKETINQENENTEAGKAEADLEEEDKIKAAKEDNSQPTNKIAEGESRNETAEKENNPVISNSDGSGKVYTVQANRGEGITHLARKALNEYLQETESGSELTKEHKIYIEDYMQNKTGSESIEINHQETFSEELIEEAISSAKQLTPKSLDNLKKYTI